MGDQVSQPRQMTGEEEAAVAALCPFLALSNHTQGFLAEGDVTSDLQMGVPKALSQQTKA